MAAAGFVAISSIQSGFSGGPSEAGIALLVGYLYAAAGTAVLVPLYLFLRRVRLVRWWSAMGSGALLGALFSAVIGTESFSAPLLRGYAPLSLIGAVSGLCFWCIQRGYHT